MQFINVTVLIAAVMALTSASPIDVSSNLKPIERRSMTGRGTYYNQFGSFGSCEKQFPDSAFIAALGPAHRNVGQLNCGRRIWARALNGPGNGNRVEVEVWDTCPECDPSSVDFSVGAFDQLTNNQKEFGLITVEWDWM